MHDHTVWMNNAARKWKILGQTKVDPCFRCVLVWVLGVYLGVCVSSVIDATFFVHSFTLSGPKQ